MAKSKKENKAVVEAIDAVPVEKAESSYDEMELLQVDAGDQVKLKQILDETVAAAMLELVPEDYRFDNIKLGLMTSACLFACIAQFAPVPFPDCRPILGVCCCMYFILSGILQLITTFIDKDCILLTQPLPASKNKNLNTYGIRVRTHLPRFSEFFTLILEFQKMPETPCVEQKWSVGQFLDADGMFDEVGLMEAVKEVYSRLEQGKYDAPDRSTKGGKKKAD
jgi:signal peptidase complex subunit 2